MRGMTVLLADDDRSIRTVLSQALTRVGCRVRATGSTNALWRMVDEGEGDIIVTDVHMPDGDALDLLPAIRRRRPELPVIVMSAQNTVMTAIRAAEVGAYEYLPKPFDLKELLGHVQTGLESKSKLADAPSGRGRSGARGEPAADRPLARDAGCLPHHGAADEHRPDGDDLGRISGTGKELVARALHNYGKRSKGPFVAINMAAIPRELIESELFGHERGAFTGATERAAGKFEQAQGGTLFLDEIGDMPPEAQTRLLRVLQEGEFTAVGGRAARQADVRIIAATHQNLRSLIAEGRFREDLYYRLNVVPIRLPPLRDRIGDLPDLARSFLRRAEQEGLARKTISSDAYEVLKGHSWPGNVRELENMVRRLAVLCVEDQIPAEMVEAELTTRASDQLDLREESVAGRSLGAAVEVHLERYFARHGDSLPPAGLYGRILKEVELPLIALTLSATRGNQLKAADLLGINRNTLRKKIRELDIPVTRGNKLM